MSYKIESTEREMHGDRIYKELFTKSNASSNDFTFSLQLFIISKSS